MYHGHTSSFWVIMFEGASVQPQYNSISCNRSGWKIIAVSRSREDTERVSYGEIRRMAPCMLLIFEHYVPILDKRVKKVLQKYILQLALSRKHGERQSPGQQYNSPTALLVWQSQLLGMTSHSDSIGHQNCSSGILWMSCVHWQWTIALSELIQAFVNLPVWGCRAVAWAFWSYRGERLTAKEETFLQKQNWNPLLLSLKIMFKF